MERVDREYWYLASPYSKYPHGREAAYVEAVKNVSLFYKNPDCRNTVVFSPIAHTHPMSTIGGVEGDHDFWMRIDYPMLDKACGLIVLKLEGWEESRGVNSEIGYALGARKTIVYMNQGELPKLFMSRG